MKGSSGWVGRICIPHPRSWISPLLCLWIGLAGCVMVPIPTTEQKVLAGKPITEEQLVFLTPGITTTREVVERLGNPIVIWEEARVWVYNWQMRQGILFWAVGGASQGAMSGGAGMTDIPKHYLLLIQFDGQERLRRFERAVCPLYTPYSKFLKEWVGNEGGGSLHHPPGSKESPG